MHSVDQCNYTSLLCIYPLGYFSLHPLNESLHYLNIPNKNILNFPILILGVKSTFSGTLNVVSSISPLPKYCSMNVSFFITTDKISI